MTQAEQSLRKIGIAIPDILIPAEHVDMEKWAVVACDQYTSERDYWDKVDEFVGTEPSTLRMIFPEVFLEEPHPENRVASINSHMRDYVRQGVFREYMRNFFLVHRQSGKQHGRWGLMVALDLEYYDYSKDSRTPIRATEGTIVSRIPPRKLIRKDAPLELPHILVLINDLQRSVIEPLASRYSTLEKVYATKLMMGGGSVTAYRIDREPDLEAVATAFENLQKALDPNNPLLFAVGDGNHSLATAKSCWEDIKRDLSESQKEHHPARFAMVELENIYDPGLMFEPIHRVLFNIQPERFLSILHHYCSGWTAESMSCVDMLVKEIHRNDSLQRFGYACGSQLIVLTLQKPCASIAAGTLQAVIDEALNDTQIHVDYIHGEAVTKALGSKPGNIGLFLPAIAKETFFSSIVKDGALPRKTFSMGEAHEKRFYLEARRITL